MPTEKHEATILCDDLGIEHEITLEIEWDYEKPEPTVDGGYSLEDDAHIFEDISGFYKYRRFVGSFSLSPADHKRIQEKIERLAEAKAKEAEAERQYENEQDRKGIHG